MRSAMQQLAITARAFHRILKLGRTIADPSALLSAASLWDRASLAGVEEIQAAHPSTVLRTGLAEVIQYRPRR
ncbi:MAG: hypothetical protein JXA42_14445 [Anaerolineales bacterium]|nr:hypothetical protein [Anaerolineales bacterium]